MPYKEIEMRRFPLRAAIVSAFVVGASLAVLFVLNHNRSPRGGPGVPLSVLVAKVSIPKGTSGRVIDTTALYSIRFVQWRRMIKGAFVDPSEFRGEVATRTIPAGARLTAAEFALPGPIYYPRGYPKSVSASRTPRKMSDYLGPRSFASDLAVAPGVWVDGSPPEAAIDGHVANGTLVGYCRSVRAFQAHNPKIPFATKCWRT
jgi:hypothetical protein